MIQDFQIFEDYMASQSFQGLTKEEKEEFINSYRNLLEEEMDGAVDEMRYVLQQRNIGELFWRMHGHLDDKSLKEKDDQWYLTFGIRPLHLLKA